MKPYPAPRCFTGWCTVCAALLLSAPGCIGPPHITNIEEDGGSLFCTFYHYRYPGEDQGTLMSTDSGRTWSRLYPAQDGEDVEFVGRCQAGLLAELGNRQWYTSSDYGRTWSETATLRPREHRICGPTPHRGSPVAFLGTYHGVWRSEDGGRTWEGADTTGMGTSWITSIAAQDSRVVAVGRSLTRGVFDDWITTGGWSGYISEDRGTTWREIRLPAGDMSSLVASSGSFFNSPNPWGWDQRRRSWNRPGSAYRLDDGDTTWMDIGLSGVMEILDCDPVPAALVQTDTANTGILISTDGGRTWVSEGGAPPAGCDFVGVYPSGAGMFAYARHDPDGTFFRSHDRGVTWERIRLTGY